MNAGTATQGILDAIVDVRVIDAIGIRDIAKEDIPYGYRQGGLPLDAVIISARFALTDAPAEHVHTTIQSFLEKKRTQPKGYTSGSVFKNPPESPAGLLIEQAGMKGFTVGGAKVSEVHANFIINDGKASTSDIKTLIQKIKQRVQEKFDIELIEEVRIIG